MMYPTSCLSAYCGRIQCDGCRHRPVLVRYYQSTGELQKWERRQDELREEAKREEVKHG